MVKVIWTEESRYWLNYIFHYIASDNPAAAINTVNGIYEKVQILQNLPETGYKYQHSSNSHIRIILHGHYRIAYLYREKDGEIDVLGVFHGKMEIRNYLRLS
ncbi:MAG: type II toxin-antitoxin system RelE/ParE family toxin [Victivallales bacterium]